MLSIADTGISVVIEVIANNSTLRKFHKFPPLFVWSSIPTYFQMQSFQKNLTNSILVNIYGLNLRSIIKYEKVLKTIVDNLKNDKTI